jgi:site-specific recombinase XerD
LYCGAGRTPSWHSKWGSLLAPKLTWNWWLESAWKCSDGPHCQILYVRKWRHTFATQMTQSGIDIKTLQTLLGHKNIAITEKSLKELRLR